MGIGAVPAELLALVPSGREAMGFKALVEGRPEDVLSQAADMQRSADRMTDAARRLASLVNSGSYVSESTDQLRDVADDLEVVMVHAATRYREAGAALASYAHELEAAQQQAGHAVQAAQSTSVASATAAVAAAHAHQAVVQIKHAAQVATDDDWHQAQVDTQRADAELQHQAGALAAAVGQFLGAVTAAAAAGENAAESIQQAVVDSTLNDGWADDFEGWKQRVLIPLIDSIAEALDLVGDVVGILTLALFWVPGLGEILVAADAVLALAKLAVARIQFLVGEKSLAQLEIDTIFAALSVLGGAGKALSLAGKSGELGTIAGGTWKSVIGRAWSTGHLWERDAAGKLVPTEYGGEVFQALPKKFAEMFLDWHADRATELDVPILLTPHDFTSATAFTHHDAGTVTVNGTTDVQQIIDGAFDAPPVTCSSHSSGFRLVA